jgi:hypothetical protein
MRCSQVSVNQGHGNFDGRVADMGSFQIDVDKSRAWIGRECQSEPVVVSFRAIRVETDCIRRIAGKKSSTFARLLLYRCVDFLDPQSCKPSVSCKVMF